MNTVLFAVWRMDSAGPNDSRRNHRLCYRYLEYSRIRLNLVGCVGKAVRNAGMPRRPIFGEAFQPSRTPGTATPSTVTLACPMGPEIQYPSRYLSRNDESRVLPGVELSQPEPGSQADWEWLTPRPPDCPRESAECRRLRTVFQRSELKSLDAGEPVSRKSIPRRSVGEVVDCVLHGLFEELRCISMPISVDPCRSP